MAPYRTQVDGSAGILVALDPPAYDPRSCPNVPRFS
jgi:hypothetical protein